MPTKTLTFYDHGGDFLNCYGDDAIIAARELCTTILTLSVFHATEKRAAGTPHIGVPKHAQQGWFAYLNQRGFEPLVVVESR